MRKLFSIVCATIALVASAAVGDDFNFQNCTYLITKEYVNSAEYGEITCVGLNATGRAAQSLDLTIPNLLSRGSNPTRHYRVTKILDKGFYGCENIVSLTINDKIDLIGSGAFASCTNLKTLVCGAVEIGQQAFSGCEKLNKITLREGVQKLDSFCFQKTSISYIDIPASVTSIGRLPFMGCKSMFQYSVSKDNQYYADDGRMLYSKDYNSLIYSPEGINCNKGYLLRVHAKTTIVETEAFNGFIGLAWIVLPYGIKTIKDNAFTNSNIDGVIIPSTIESIGTNAFRSCKNLTHLFVNKKVPLYVTGLLTDSKKPHLHVPLGREDAYKNSNWNEVEDYNALGIESFDLINENDIAVTITSTKRCQAVDGVTYDGRCKMVKSPKYYNNPNAIVKLPNSITVGDRNFALTSIATRAKTSLSDTESWSYYGGEAVDSIDYAAFINTQVKYVAFKNASYVGKHAFEGCSNLVAFHFGQKLRYIGANAFMDCKLNGDFPSGLGTPTKFSGNICLPVSLLTLGADAFYGTGVKRIVVPSTVENLSPDAFRGMLSVQEIYLNQWALQWEQFRFTDVPSTCMLYVPVAKTKAAGKAFKSANITGGAFDFAHTNSSIADFSEFKEPATILSNQAFTRDGVEYAGKVKYVRCPTIAVPDKFKASNYLVNNGKKYLVTEIGDSCFTNFANLTATDLSEMTALERIGHHAYSGSSVTSLTIPKTCTKFGLGAFTHATKLKELLILGTNTRTWEGQYYDNNASDFKIYVHNQVFYRDYWYQDYKIWKMKDGSSPLDALNIYVQPNYDNYNLGVCIPLDFEAAHVNAYVASSCSSDNNTITMEKVARVPAKTGVILTDLEPYAIYKIPRALSASGTSVLSASATGDVDVNSLTCAYVWNCATKKFWRPSDTSTPYYTGPGRSYLSLDHSSSYDKYYTSLWPDTPAGKKGDVNGDGTVDITDANILINIILGKDNAGNYGGRADVDGNGTVDVSDANAVINTILGK